MGKKSSSTTTSDKSQHNFDPLPAEFRRAFTGLYRPLAHRHGQLPGIKWASQKSWRYWKQFKTARLRSPVACPWNASGWPELFWGSGHLWNGGFFNMLSWGAWRYGKTGGIMLVSCDWSQAPVLVPCWQICLNSGPDSLRKSVALNQCVWPALYDRSSKLLEDICAAGTLRWADRWRFAPKWLG